MLKKISSIIITALFLCQISFTIHTNDVKANKNNSTIIWTGSKPTGSHTGNVSLKNGHLTFDHGHLVGGNFVIDMSSVTCTDIESEKKNKYLLDHLKSEDFFAVDEFPEAILSITSVEKLEGMQHQMYGNMTIKGITKPISFLAEVNSSRKGFNAIAKIIIDRTKWGIEYKSGNVFKDLGDKIIYDDIEFDIFLVSQK